MENRRKRARDLLWTSTAYFGEGLPWSFLHQLVTEYLTAIGAPRALVGYTSWFHLPVTLKPLFSPAVDLFGTRRRWLLAMQLAIGLGMLGAAALVATGSGGGAPVFWALLALVAVLHAVHDIACDGFFMIALSREGQALYSGTRLAAFRLAMYVGGSALVILAARTSWPLALGLAGVLMGVSGAVNAALLPHPDERADGSPRPSPAAVLETFATFLRQPHALLVLAFVLTYQLSDALTFAMSSPLLAELGVGTEARGWIRGLSLTASITAPVLAGWLLARDGLERWLRPFTYVMAIPFYLAIALLRPPLWAITALVVVEQFTGNLASTALTVFLMRRCKRAFSASHYAFFTSIAALGRTAAGGFSGHASEALGHEAYFLVCFLAALPAVALVHFVPKVGVDDAPASGPVEEGQRGG